MRLFLAISVLLIYIGYRCCLYSKASILFSWFLAFIDPNMRRLSDACPSFYTSQLQIIASRLDILTLLCYASLDMRVDMAVDQYKIMKDFVGLLGKLKFGHFTDCLSC